MTVGWKLDGRCREALLERFPPRYSQVLADRVALLGHVDDDVPVPVLDAKIVGRVDDEDGVEAMVVSIYGTTDRYDGNCWHIPWSHEPDRDAADSRVLIDQLGWTEVQPLPLRLEPAKW
jgi:hypothetical protein